MMIQFEVSPPFRWRPKLERFSFGWRFIWLWGAVAYFPRLGINGLARAYREQGRREILDDKSDPEQPGT